MRSPSLSPTGEDGRSGARWIWSWLLVLLMVVIGIWAFVAGREASESDRGVRGPPDQASPQAPPREKARPSTGR